MKNDRSILSLEELLDKNLVIPIYQRPYEWTRANVLTLLDDISLEYIKNEEINLGTIILHNDNKKLNIVDGQQRLITLSILLYILNIKNKSKLLNNTFQCTSISEKNIIINKKEIDVFLNNQKKNDKFDLENYKRYLKEKIKFYVIVSNDISEVFQLFDGRNSKYKSLDEIDLLKAYHLGTIHDDVKKVEALTIWSKNINDYFKLESSKNKIKFLFDDVLFNIYNWSLNKDRKNFKIEDIYLYKGYNKDCNYNYVNYYSSNNNNNIYLINKPFESGICFFRMLNDFIAEYEKNINSKDDNLYEKVIADTKQKKNVYPEEKFNIHFQYINIVYYAALFLFSNKYGDKINEYELKIVKDYIYKWSLVHRISKNSVKYDSINKYIVDNENFFFKCNNSLDIRELFKLPYIELNEFQKGSKKDSNLSKTRWKLWKKLK